MSNNNDDEKGSAIVGNIVFAAVLYLIIYHTPLLMYMFGTNDPATALKIALRELSASI